MHASRGVVGRHPRPSICSPMTRSTGRAPENSGTPSSAAAPVAPTVVDGEACAVADGGSGPGLESS